MSSSGRSGNSRRNRQRYSGRRDESQRQDRKKQTDSILTDGKFEKSKLSLYERPQWTAPELPANPITSPDCPWCGKPINDIAMAITDKDTGLPVHFDCVLARIGESEALEANDAVCYIGGGRFGIVHYINPPGTKDFTIKKIFEWENKDSNIDWRRPISEYFSLT